MSWDGPRIVAVSGLPGAGKSTVSAELGRRLPRLAHVEADNLQRLIVSGGEWPGADGRPTEAAALQLRLRLRHAVMLAKSFSENGFVAVIDDIICGPRFDELVEEFAGTTFGFVMLLPDFEHVKARWRAMNSPFVNRWDWIDRLIREETPRAGLWLDTTSLSPSETADLIVEQSAQTRVTIS